MVAKAASEVVDRVANKALVVVRVAGEGCDLELARVEVVVDGGGGAEHERIGDGGDDGVVREEVERRADVGEELGDADAEADDAVADLVTDPLHDVL